MKTIFSIMLPALTVFVLNGCLTTNFVYPNNAANMVQPAAKTVLTKKVAVVPFDDARIPTNTFATTYLGLIPLYPFGYVEYNRPDAACGFNTTINFNFDPSEDLAKAAALSFRKSHLFSNVFFTFGGEKDKADFVLEGKIVSTYFKGRNFTYGLSMAGSYLWLLGAPSGTALNRLALVLTLKDRRGNTVWEYAADQEERQVQWIYCSLGQDVSMYPALMQQIMNDAVTDLNAKIKAEPGKFN